MVDPYDFIYRQILNLASFIRKNLVKPVLLRDKMHTIPGRKIRCDLFISFAQIHLQNVDFLYRAFQATSNSYVTGNPFNFFYFSVISVYIIVTK